jgi:predicted ATP-grasp superfamily ATP-dependent carboligase
MNMEDIKVYEIRRLDLRGATVIDGFPSVGLVSTICANYLISSLNLKQIGIMDSIYFPTVSVVRDSEPLNPVRIYGGEIMNKDDEKKLIVVFISEFQPPPKLIKLIAGTILDWIVEQNCGVLVSPEGLVIERAGDTDEAVEASFNKDDILKGMISKGQGESDDGSGEKAIVEAMLSMEFANVADTGKKSENVDDRKPKETGVDLLEGTEEAGENIPDDLEAPEALDRPQVDVYGIASTKEARELLNDKWIMPFSEGVISGVAGVLLNEGKRRGFNVISLLAETRTDYPDARAAAKVIEAIDEAVLNIGIDVEPLYKEAEDIEMKIKMMRAQVEGPKRRRHTSPSMYG